MESPPTPLPLPNPRIGKTLKVETKTEKKLKEKMGCLKRNLYKTVNTKILFVQLHMLDRSVDDSITFYSFITFLK